MGNCDRHKLERLQRSPIEWGIFYRPLFKIDKDYKDVKLPNDSGNVLIGNSFNTITFKDFSSPNLFGSY